MKPELAADDSREGEAFDRLVDAIEGGLVGRRCAEGEGGNIGIADDRLEVSPYVLDVQGRIVQVELGEADRFQHVGVLIERLSKTQPGKGSQDQQAVTFSNLDHPTSQERKIFLQGGPGDPVVCLRVMLTVEAEHDGCEIS